MPKTNFRHLAGYQRREKELEELSKVWEGLSPWTRAVILITAGVWKAPNPYAVKLRFQRAKKGETPVWLLPAMNLLRDTGGQMPDREIARRVGVSHSTLTRNETYMRARQTNQHVAKPRKVVTRDPRVLSNLFSRDSE